jgi:hypothetical protein
VTRINQWTEAPSQVSQNQQHLKKEIKEQAGITGTSLHFA